MKPSEKIIELRGEMSRAKFAEKFKTKDYTIRGIEDETQAIPDELAIALEAEYNIPFKWWKTGEGPMLIEEQTEKALPESPAELREVIKQTLGVNDEEYDYIMRNQGVQGLKKIVKLYVTSKMGNDAEKREALVKLDGIVQGMRMSME